MKLVNQTAVRAIVKAKGKRCSQQYLDMLEAHVQGKVEKSASYHNGGKKTLDMEVAAYFGLNK